MNKTSYNVQIDYVGYYMNQPTTYSIPTREEKSET